MTLTADNAFSRSARDPEGDNYDMDLLPSNIGMPRIPPPLISIARSGKTQQRHIGGRGREWTEVWAGLPITGEDKDKVYGFIKIIEDGFYRGTVFEVWHPIWHPLQPTDKQDPFNAIIYSYTPGMQRRGQFGIISEMTIVWHESFIPGT